MRSYEECSRGNVPWVICIKLEIIAMLNTARLLHLNVGIFQHDTPIH
jgi:hypothetical protein